MRRAIERQMPLMTRPNQTALLAAFRGPLSEEFESACMNVAADRRNNIELRTAAVMALTQSGAKHATALLRDAFLDNHDSDILIELAEAIVQLHDSPPELQRLHRGRNPQELVLQTGRLRALLCAGHPQVMRLCLEQLRRPGLDAKAAGSLLRAVRQSLLPRPANSAALPEPIGALLR